MRFREERAVCVCKKPSRYDASTANAKNNTRFIPDTQAKESTMDWALSFLATRAKRPQNPD